MKIINHKLNFYYRLHDECIIGLALNTNMVLAIRRKQIQLNCESQVIHMKHIYNIFDIPIPILILKQTQKKWLKLMKKYKLIVIVSEIFSSQRLFKAKIHLASKFYKGKKEYNRSQFKYNMSKLE